MSLRATLLAVGAATALSSCAASDKAAREAPAAAQRPFPAAYPDICDAFVIYGSTDTQELALKEWPELQKEHPSWKTPQYIVDQTQLRAAVRRHCGG